MPWLERMNFCSSYSSRPSSVATTMRVASTNSTVAGVVGQDDVARVQRRAALHARADDRRVRLEQRHGLALHVRAHQGAVGVVVLEERDHRRGDGPDLLRRDVHVVDLLPAGTARRCPACVRHRISPTSLPLVVELRVRLRDHDLLLDVRVEVVDLVGDLAVLDDAVRGGDEAVLGDLRVGATASRSGRCSGPPASRSGTCGRSGSGGRRAPRSARARA